MATVLKMPDEEPEDKGAKPIFPELQEAQKKIVETGTAVAKEAMSIIAAFVLTMRIIFNTLFEKLTARFTVAMDRFRMKAFLFNCLVLPVLGLLYIKVNSMGLRISLPLLSERLHKFFLFSFLGNFVGYRDLDWAYPAALFQMVIVWIFSQYMLEAYLFGTISAIAHLKGNEQFARRFVVAIGAILLLWDMAMFNVGISDTSLFGTGFSPIAIICTLGYTAGLLGAAFLHVVFKNQE